MQESWPFIKPVNKKQMRHYYDVIKNPMDLETMDAKANKHAYHSRAEFLADLELIYHNSVTFNGHDNDYTHKARKILDVAASELDSYDYLNDLEKKIRMVQEREIDHDEVDSLGMSLGADDDSRAGQSSCFFTYNFNARTTTVTPLSDFEIPPKHNLGISQKLARSRLSK